MHREEGNMARISRGVVRKGKRATVRGTRGRPAPRATTRRAAPKGKPLSLEGVKKAAVSAGTRAGSAAKRVASRIRRSRRAQLAAVAAAGMVAAAVGMARKRRKKK